MDALKAEIAKKRKVIEDKKLLVRYNKLLLQAFFYDPNKTFPQTDGKKYFKRGDLLAREEEDYLKKYGHKTEESASPLKINSG